ncbi:hypothetical protein [Pseudomonas inefficax]|nr:hypothetical protein [Pseudomonas sp. CMAA1741]MEC4563136.1 hypothetical protein [Pseudomonas sp. CMAA1741]
MNLIAPVQLVSTGDATELERLVPQVVQDEICGHRDGPDAPLRVTLTRQW